MSDTNTSRTELSELSKHEIIDKITKGFKIHHKSLITKNDDAVILNFEKENTVFTNRIFNEGVDFDLTYFPLKHLGYKFVAVSVSDIVAMNVNPTHISVNISVSNRFSLEALEELFKGIKMCCERYKIDLAKCNISSSQYGLIVSVAAFGSEKDEEIIYKNTAQENDLVCVSGDLGGAYLGLLLLEREKSVFNVNPNMQPDLDGYDYILERQLKPEPRVDIIEELKKLNIKPTAMAHVADGLSSEMMNICTASDKGCVIYEEKIPLDAMTMTAADMFKIQPATAALNGGDDHELIFTISINDFEKIKQIEGVSVIGHITEPNAGMHLSTVNGPLIKLKALGWK